MGDTLLEIAGAKSMKGCLSCGHYDPTCETNLEFVDDNFYDEGGFPRAVNNRVEYWCWCKLRPDEDVAVRLYCGDWEPMGELARR